MKNVRQILNLASKHHRDGNYREAAALYHKVLSVAPENPDILHMLGMLSIQTGRNKEAVRFIRKAVGYKKTAAYLTNLAAALQNLGENEEAITACRQAILIRQDNFSAYNTLGNALRETGKFNEAIESFQHAILLRNDVAEVYFNLAIALKESGDLSGAASGLLKAVEINPGYAEAYNCLGNVLNLQDRPEAAEACYLNALRSNPEYIEAHYNLGNILNKLKKYDEAILHYHAVISLKPDFAEAYFNLGNALNSLEKRDEAVSHYRKAIELKPDFAEAYNGAGNAYREMGNGEKAMEYYRSALKLKPGFAEVYYNIGNVLLDQGDAPDALASCRKAIDLKPDLAEAHWNSALALLTMGELEDGWKKYEWRFLKNDAHLPPFRYPLWDGSSLKGKTLLVCAEQGVGDEIMFASCLPEVISRAHRCLVECDRRLLPLFSRSFPEVLFFERRDSPREKDRNDGVEGSRIDLQIPVGSLPRYFRADYQSFSGQKAYLRPDPGKVRIWEDRLASLGEGLKIGISWRGGKDAYVRNIRSTTLEQWAELFSLKGIHFINLQYGDCANELKEVENTLGVTIHDWEDADPLKDLDNFAAQIAALDLIISVDNSTVHMAGALGIPVWTVLPFGCDWRWMRDFEDTLWYPSIRLFRQQRPGDWTAVFEKILGLLGEAISQAKLISGPLSCENSYTALSRRTMVSRSDRRVVLLNDTSNWYHWGCTGTSTAIHQAISGMDFAIEGVAIKGIYDLKHTPTSSEDFDDRTFFDAFASDNRWIIQGIKDADIVVINGEGSLHGLSTNTLNLLYLAYTSKRYLGKKVQIINHSCYPEISPEVNDTEAWAIYRKVYSVIDFAAVREPVSFELLRRAGIPVHRSFDCLPLYITANYSGSGTRMNNRIVIAGSVAWKYAGIGIFSEYIRTDASARI